MTIADHFERTPDAGFTRAIDPVAAHRQFVLSLGLVAVITVATIAATLTLKVGETRSASANITVQAPQMMHVQQADQARHQPAG